MKILALETSTATGGIALWNDGEILFDERFPASRGKSANFFEVLQRVLAEVSGINRIAVGTGPGSYNGIRVALSTGKGVQLVRKAAFVALSSSLCIEAEGDYVYFGDARGGQFHFSRVSGRSFADGPRLILPEEVKSQLVSSGLPAYSDAEQEGITGYGIKTPSARILAELAVDAPVLEKMPEPLYLKPPHITQPRSAQGCIQPRSE